MIEITYEEGEQLLEKYKRLYPTMKDVDILEQMIKTNYILTK